MLDRDLELDHPPYRLSGTVLAALLNHRGDWDAIGARALEPPYGAPPRLPVLGVRPPNTLSRPGGLWTVPAGADGVATGATLGIVIGRPACRVDLDGARRAVAGYLVANDGSLPVPGHYRPALRQRARDGLCVLGSAIVPAAALPAPDAAEVVVQLDGETVQASDTGDRIRGVFRLIADVSAFMTLSPGDVLLLGAAPDAPVARVGQTVTVSIAGVGEVSTSVVAEGGP